MIINGNNVGTYDGIITIFSGYDDNVKIKRFILTAAGTDEDKFVSLNDCLKMIGYDGSNSVTVVLDDATHGEIYNYGNYGDVWYQVGTTQGYA